MKNLLAYIIYDSERSHPVVHERNGGQRCNVTRNKLEIKYIVRQVLSLLELGWTYKSLFFSFYILVHLSDCEWDLS